MTTLLVLFALFVAAVSTLFVSDATLGVWFIAGAILLAALARIAQASAHHKEMRELFRKEPDLVTTNPKLDSLP